MHHGCRLIANLRIADNEKGRGIHPENNKHENSSLNDLWIKNKKFEFVRRAHRKKNEKANDENITMNASWMNRSS